jgi:hypothetical protein
MAHQVLKQQELLRRQLDLLTIDRDGMARNVDDDGAIAQHLTGRVLSDYRAPQPRGDACDEFPGAERLGHVIISAALQTCDTVRFITASGQHDDWQM